jgi:hypothetical protein
MWLKTGRVGRGLRGKGVLLMPRRSGLREHTPDASGGKGAEVGRGIWLRQGLEACLWPDAGAFVDEHAQIGKRARCW